MKTNTMNASSPRLRAIARASGLSILAATTAASIRTVATAITLTLESCVNRRGGAATSQLRNTYR